MSDWRDISTAPKDGRPILGVTKYGLMAVISWCDPTAGDREQGVPIEHAFDWYMNDGKNDPIHFRAWMDLTHWMPSPSPPKP